MSQSVVAFFFFQLDPPSIRPMPKIDLHGGFAMCDLFRCKGISCTYAHSKEEQRAWNSKLHKQTSE